MYWTIYMILNYCKGRMRRDDLDPRCANLVFCLGVRHAKVFECLVSKENSNDHEDRGVLRHTFDRNNH